MTVAVCLLAGCGDDEPSGTGSASAAVTTTAAATAATETAAASAGEVKLALAELTFKSGEKVGFVLKADGSLMAEDGTMVAIVGADGSMSKVDGTRVAKLNADGSVDSEGKKLPLNIDTDGVMTAGDQKLSFNDAGVLQGGNPDAPPMAVEGLTPETRRTAMLILTMMLTPRDAPPVGDAPTGVPAKAPVDAPGE